MPPNFQRFLPLMLIAALAIFVLPTVLKKHKSGPSASTRATQTIDAMNLIDKGEQSYKAAHSRLRRILQTCSRQAPGWQAIWRSASASSST